MATLADSVATRVREVEGLLGDVRPLVPPAGGCDGRLDALGRRLRALVRGCGGVAGALPRRTQAAAEAEKLRDPGWSRVA